MVCLCVATDCGIKMTPEQRWSRYCQIGECHWTENDMRRQIFAFRAQKDEKRLLGYPAGVVSKQSECSVVGLDQAERRPQREQFNVHLG
jgi:hypothetical protein